jgi:hypothetical protein
MSRKGKYSFFNMDIEEIKPGPGITLLARTSSNITDLSTG